MARGTIDQLDEARREMLAKVDIDRSHRNPCRRRRHRLHAARGRQPHRQRAGKRHRQCPHSFYIFHVALLI
jgi:hypothetical protein